ncbi:MAG: hypothetical protein LBC55_08590 [Desulfovibrio sp.]|jgi:hypothetical protein|nr:hypothetical protein [Desulfovibrio sp.]
MRNAVVTLAVGKKYKILFNRVARSSWEMYCKKFSYDLIVATELFDTSARALSRSPAWQKLLILSQEFSSRYDNIIWLDADIIINTDRAEDILHDAPVEKVCGVDAYAIPSKYINTLSLERQYRFWDANNIKYINNLSPSKYYLNRGIQCGAVSSVLQTGVFSCSPRHHKEIFEYVYYTYEDRYGAEYNYEMPAMSYELVKNNFTFWIQPEFNVTTAGYISAFYPFLFNTYTLESGEILKFQALLNIYDLSFFMHFAGCANFMLLFASMKKRYNE